MCIKQNDADVPQIARLLNESNQIKSNQIVRAVDFVVLAKQSSLSEPCWNAVVDANMSCDMDSDLNPRNALSVS